MLLSALLLAGAVQTVPAVPTPALHPSVVEAACRAAGLELVDRPARTAKPKVRRLGDLPPANHTLTVLRSVDGCPVSSTIRYGVDRPAGR